MKIWPPSLPSPRIEISFEPSVSVVANEMETGRIRQRKRFTSSRKRYSVSLILSKEQLSTFEGFHKYDLEQGASSFGLQVPSSETDSVDYTEGLMLNGSYQASALAGNIKWGVSFSFVVENPPIISESVYALRFLQQDEADFISAVNNLETEVSHFNDLHTWE